jgi:hypothetical protein
MFSYSEHSGSAIPLIRIQGLRSTSLGQTRAHSAQGPLGPRGQGLIVFFKADSRIRHRIWMIRPHRYDPDKQACIIGKGLDDIPDIVELRSCV